MKFIAYFTHEEYGYKEFEAKDMEEADELMEKFNYEGNFPDDLDRVKNEGWVMVDLSKEFK